MIDTIAAAAYRDNMLKPFYTEASRLNSPLVSVVPSTTETNACTLFADSRAR
jgi:hypothetical protein